jgi:transcription initiation factor IIE alpha subunit
MNGQISCPDCGNSIVFDQQALLRGQTFSCPGCQATLGLARESVATVSDALAKLESLRKQANDGRRSAK